MTGTSTEFYTRAKNGGWGSSATIVTRLRAGRSGVQIQAGARNFRVPKNVQTGSGTHPASCSIEGVNRPGREADHSPASSAEVRNEWKHSSTTHICIHGMYWSDCTVSFNYTVKKTLDSRNVVNDALQRSRFLLSILSF